jgi:nucleoside-diphosphate-sugar epimerase
MSFKNSKILVVGGAGFVGSNLVHKLLQEAPREIIVVDNLLSADMVNVPKDVRFILGSIADDAALKQLELDVDYIFHLSTYHGNQSSIADPLQDHANNTYTTLKLCEHFYKSTSLKKVVYAAAGCTVAKKTFDETEATDEDASVSLYLDSPYQISKMVGEFYGNYYYLRYGFPFVKARFQNVYGPREILGAGRWRGTSATVWRNVTPTFMWKAMHGMPLPLEKGGVATRDFIYSDDLCEGLMACALKGDSGGVYNLASGVETSIKELAETINALTGNTKIDMADARPWDRSGRRFGTTEKSEKEIGFKAHTSLTDGLQKTLKWTKDHYGDIVRCMQQHTYYMPELLSLMINTIKRPNSL